MHQNFNKFQNRCVDGNVNAPKWIRHLGDAYNIIRKTRKTELPEDWSISRLQEELAKSRDFVTDLSPEHPTLRLELLSESERKQVDEAFAMHVEGAYYGVGEEGIVDERERAQGDAPTLAEVCETVIGWLKTVPTTFVSVDKFRRFTRGNYQPRGGRHHPSSSSPSSSASTSSPSSSTSSDPSAPPSDSSFQGRHSSSYSRGSSSQYSSKPYSGKKFSNSSYNKSSTYHRNNFNSAPYPAAPAPATANNDTQTPPTNDEDISSVTATPAPSASASSETPNISQISRQVDSSYRLSRDFDKVIEPTHSGSNSESDDTNSNYSNYSNESAPESPALETESPSESSAENTENEYVWGASLSHPRPPSGRRELLVVSSDFESVSEPASESTSESESERKSETEEEIETPVPSSSSLSVEVLPPRSPILPSFNEASFGMPKRNSLPLSPSTSSPSSPSCQRDNSNSTQA